MKSSKVIKAIQLKKKEY